MPATDVWQLNPSQVARVYERLLSLDRRFSHRLPDLAWLTAGLEACFWASIQSEEGRSIRGSLAYAAVDDCVQRIVLEQPVELSADRLRDLLPAVRPGCAALAASGAAVWGIALQVPHDAFFITIVGPGQLLLRCGERVLASLHGRVLTELPDLDVLLASSFPRLAPAQLRNVVVEASLLMRKIGHGGTIAFINAIGEGLAVNREIHAGSRYKTWSDETLAEATLKDEPENREMKARAELEREHRARAKALLLRDVVQLTATDGLLGLRDDLSVLCFGAKIEVGDEPPAVEVLDFGTLEPQSSMVADLGGTRHQSAARFAWSRADDALVLVVSQDGRCSLMGRALSRSGGPVLLVFRGFERALPPDMMTLRFGSFAPIRASLA
jgi:hypothetical protein